MHEELEAELAPLVFNFAQTYKTICAMYGEYPEDVTIALIPQDCDCEECSPPVDSIDTFAAGLDGLFTAWLADVESGALALANGLQTLMEEAREADLDPDLSIAVLQTKLANVAKGIDIIGEKMGEALAA